MDYKDLKESVISVLDFPKKGIDFKDITPIFLDYKKVDFILEEMVSFAKTLDFDVVVAPESRGFLFGVQLALRLKKPFVAIRKPNKLPRETVSIQYDLEYGKGTLEVHKDDIKESSKVLIVDDLIATGGTSVAIQKLMAKLNATVVGQVYLIELVSICNHDLLEGKFFSLIKY